MGDPVSAPRPPTLRPFGIRSLMGLLPSLLISACCVALGLIVNQQYTFDPGLAKDLYAALAGGCFLVMSLSPMVYLRLQESFNRLSAFANDYLEELSKEVSLLKSFGRALGQSEYTRRSEELETLRASANEYQAKILALRKRELRAYRWFLVLCIIILGTCLLLLSAVNLVDGALAFYQVIALAGMILQGIYIAGYSFTEMAEEIERMNDLWLKMRRTLRAHTVKLENELSILPPVRRSTESGEAQS